MEIEAIDPDDVPLAAETADILKQRLSLISERKGFEFERTGNTACTVKFKTTMSPAAVETLLTTRGEMGIYELVTGEKLKETARLISEAAEADSVNNPGMYGMLGKYWSDDFSRIPELFYVREDDIGTVMPFLQGMGEAVPRDACIMKGPLEKGAAGNKYNIYVVRLNPDGNPAIDQSRVEKAYVEYSRRYDYSYIGLQFDTEGALRFAKLTEDNIGWPLVFALDGEIVYTPMVNSRIEGGKALITGDFDNEELAVWAAILNTAPLKLPVTAERIQ